MSIEQPKLPDCDLPPIRNPPQTHEESEVPKIVITEELDNFDISLSSEDSGTETETEMSDRRNEKHHESSKGSSSKSSSKTSSKSGIVSGSKSSSRSSKSKKDDWSEVAEPDERRRIQNRIAQRKFREKSREQKETNEREVRNQQSAGLAYSTPDSDEMGTDHELSGLPWGSLSLRHVVERGNARERESQRGSQQFSYYDYGPGSGSGSGKGSEPHSR